MYDSTCKFLAVQFPEDLARWLLGKPLPLTELKPTELSLEPIRADSLIFLQSEDLVLHIEFQTDPDEDIPFRMLDYRLRVYRRYPQKEMIQVVIYLRESTSPLVRQEEFTLANTHHQFRVIRLWEMPSQPLLESKGLLPFAVLSQSDNRENLLRQISQKIETIESRKEKSNLAASTAIIAGLVLKPPIIQRLLREEIMKESLMYQEILGEGRQEGEAILVLRLLNRRLGQLSPNLLERIRSLSVENLENLGEALLDFQSEEDLKQWFSDSLGN
jgi:predicted transposase/invertase (TIGR01784 family)